MDHPQSGVEGPGSTSSLNQQHPLSSSVAQPPYAKRTRVLLSCGSCRTSKLKCDRLAPCSQCVRRGRPASCVYAPRAEKAKPAKGMAARLKRLEGMVRDMIDVVPGGAAAAAAAVPPTNAPGIEEGREKPCEQVVVQSEWSTNYVGGTHFMAILEDIDELKNYFEDPDEEEVQDPYDFGGAPELVALSIHVPRTRKEFLALLPDRSVMDRLVIHFFMSDSPSQHIIHRPTFSKEYAEFWRDPSKPPLHWIALLFMVIALGLIFSRFHAPGEMERESDLSLEERFKLYRGAAGWALVAGKYSQPGPSTIQAFILYANGEFLIDRDSQMKCYLLCATLIRLMLKMGLHRDPSKVPNLSVYEGEMRRRWWHQIIHLDLMAGFQLGLPCMIHGIESDTALPRNLRDEDFGPQSTALPPAVPDSVYTHLTYPINKARVTRVFELVAKQAHALKAPNFAEVMRVDGILEKAWNEVPDFMKMRPISQCVTDPIVLVVQRLSLALLFQKSRIVLHRRYMTETVPSKEQSYSRRTCLEAALALLDYQRDVSEAAQPGGMLHQKGWIIQSLAINDYLVSDVIIALAVQSPHYAEAGGQFDWISHGAPAPSKMYLLERLRLSLAIWNEMAIQVPDCKRAVRVVETILRKAEAARGVAANVGPMATTPADSSDAASGSMEALSIDGVATNMAPSSMGSESNQETALYSGQSVNLADHEVAQFDLSWIQQMDMSGNDYDWSQLETMMNDGVANDPFMGNASSNQSWIDRNPLDELDFMNTIS
ncbi:Fusarisetin A cluster transcription factor fsa6 [Apiospora arundinis]|uniref:Fusarisetin A cluster transcription factor fsa6 n=1 Tax=Apiospora arundinis TaxID=335852 RepID=A0ABR2I271_9PEZI